MEEEKKIQTLRAWMADKHLTVRGLADKAGVDKTTVMKIMTGVSQQVRYLTMEKLAAVLELQPEQIKEFAEIIESKKDSRLHAENMQTAVA